MHGEDTLLPLYVERGVYNFYLNMIDAEPLSSVDSAASKAVSSVGGTASRTGGSEEQKEQQHVFRRQAGRP